MTPKQRIQQTLERFGGLEGGPWFVADTADDQHIIPDMANTILDLMVLADRLDHEAGEELDNATEAHRDGNKPRADRAVERYAVKQATANQIRRTVLRGMAAITEQEQTDDSTTSKEDTRQPAGPTEHGPGSDAQ